MFIGGFEVKPEYHNGLVTIYDFEQKKWKPFRRIVQQLGILVGCSAKILFDKHGNRSDLYRHKKQ